MRFDCINDQKFTVNFVSANGTRGFDVLYGLSDQRQADDDGGDEGQKPET